jgi:uncharacterized membrane protein
MVDFFGTVALIGSGVVAGVFFAIAVSVMPTLMALPAGTYVPIHRSLGRGYHPVMPIVVVAVLVSSVGLAVFAADTVPRVLGIVAALATVGVQVVSQFGNVPINRRVEVVDERALPADWPDPRRPWRDWHYLRTVFAFVALGANAVAVTLL